MIAEVEDFSPFAQPFMEPFVLPVDEESCIPVFGLFFDLPFLVFQLEIFSYHFFHVLEFNVSLHLPFSLEINLCSVNFNNSKK